MSKINKSFTKILQMDLTNKPSRWDLSVSNNIKQRHQANHKFEMTICCISS